MISVFRNKQRSEAGFTLIEIMISMAILVMISFAIFEATTETYRLRDVLSSEGKFYNGIRLASLIVQRDIAMIYTPTLMKANPTNQPGQNGAQNGPQNMGGGSNSLGDDLGQTFKFWAPAIEETGLRPSHFVGSDTKMSFVSLSHIRVYRDTPESEFAKITYELQADTSPDASGTILVKTEDPNAFTVDEKLGFAIQGPKPRRFELLRGIQKLSFSYYQKDGNTWKITKSWDSDKDETKNRYPEIVEMKMEVANLEVPGTNKPLFEGTFKFRPEIPVNGVLDPSN